MRLSILFQGYSNLILEELEDQGNLLEYEEMARAVSSIHRSKTVRRSTNQLAKSLIQRY